MISLNTTQPVRFTPSWLRKLSKPPTFLLRAGSIMEREMLEAELASDHRAASVMPWDWDDAFRNGVAALGSGEDVGRLLDLYDTERAMVAEQQEHILAGNPEEAEACQLPPETTQTLGEVRRLLAEHWPDYRALVAQEARRAVAMPLLAFQQFCVGWENIDVAFAVGPDRRVAEEAAIKISVVELRAAGIQAYRMLYAVDAEKNLEAPSSSSGAPATSLAGATSKAAGRSGGRRGAKTPG